MSTISLDDVKRKLLSAGIVGPHRSHSRHNNITKLRACIAGDEDGCFGLSGLSLHSESEVLGYLSELTGCSPDIADLSGVDTMDPDKAVEGIIAAARRLKGFADEGATLLACTGHPTGLLEHHIRVVDAYAQAGGKPIRPREGENFLKKNKENEVRYTGGVGCLADWGALKHTHSATPMEWLLEVDPLPDVVLGDHGFAGAAIERGIPTVAVMDINDPALAIAWAEKRDVTIVPMDDNRAPAHYEPSWRVFEHILGGGDI